MMEPFAQPLTAKRNIKRKRVVLQKTASPNDPSLRQPVEAILTLESILKNQQRGR